MAKAARWGEPDDPMLGRPGPIMALLAENGKTFGYGYGEGWAMIFGSAQGPISVLPGQYVVRHNDGRITVEDELKKGEALG